MKDFLEIGVDEELLGWTFTESVLKPEVAKLYESRNGGTILTDPLTSGKHLMTLSFSLVAASMIVLPSSMGSTSFVYGSNFFSSSQSTEQSVFHMICIYVDITGNLSGTAS